MSILKGLTVLFGIWWVGVWIDTLFHFPAVIVSFGILLLCLTRGWIKLATVEPLAKGALPLLSLFFIPQAVSLFSIWDQITPFFVPLFIFIITSYFLIFFFTYHCVKWMLLKKARKLEKTE